MPKRKTTNKWTKTKGSAKNKKNSDKDGNGSTKGKTNQKLGAMDSIPVERVSSTESYTGQPEKRSRLIADCVSSAAPLPTSTNEGRAIVVRGTRHQGDYRYDVFSRNHQCTANAVVALAYGHVLAFNHWDSNTVDQILDFGDCLYKKSIANRNSDFFGNETNRDLLYVEIFSKFAIEGSYFELDLELSDRNALSGMVGVEIEGEIYINLAHGLSQLFDHFGSGVLTAAGLSVAVIKAQFAYFVFDSHSRDDLGHRTENGKACLLQFSSFDDLFNYLNQFHHAETNYTLTPFISRISRNGDTSFETLEIIREVPDILSPPLQQLNLEDEEIDPFYFPNISSRNQVDPNPTSNPSENVRKDPRKAAIGQPEPAPHKLGELNSQCPHCKALFFVSENKSCCSEGKISLPSREEYPDFLRSLLTGSRPESSSFVRNIRRYNTLLAFGSTSTKLRTDIGRGVPVVVISGQIYHSVSHVDPSDPKCGSLYFLDSKEASRRRSENDVSSACDLKLLEEIDAFLRIHNPFAQTFRNLGQVVEDEIRSKGESCIPQLGLYFHTKPGTDRRIHAAPANANEIGAVFQSVDGDLPPPGQIRLFFKQSGSIEIPKLNPIVDAICYPLIFPYGEYSWTPGMQKQNFKKRESMSRREFDNYRLMMRANEFNSILNCGRLSQQYIVDKYCDLEGDRLHYIRTHQKELRADDYAGLQDYVANLAKQRDGEGAKIGRVVVLASTFIGGPRFMHQNYQDAMAIVAKFGRPTYFITFTCNPQWDEIKNNLGKQLNPQDRPDLIARVFEQKRKAFFRDLEKFKIFGDVLAYVYVIEFQKRGLPHMHCLLTMHDVDKLRDSDEVDRFVCAELPPKNSRLLDIVMACMIHGPCGDRVPKSPCMEDGKCSKHYPKPFAEHTNIDGGSRPTYRRRNDGRSEDLIKSGRVVHRVDNRDVVPYNPYLLLKYQSHINIEYCNNVASCKYMFKYINKGPDSAVVRLDNELVFDEIRAFLDSRYISSGEAAWRLLKLPLFGKSHTVVRLPIHLPTRKPVYFKVGAEKEAIEKSKLSMLEAFFELNTVDSKARRYTYVDIPNYYSFASGKWVRRQRKASVIPRMYTISPKLVELFHLRILLLHVPGPKSFKDLLTFGGIEYNSFRESALARCLITSDQEWRSTLAHAALVKFPGGMRKLFAYLLCFCEVGDPSALWDEFKEAMCEDFLRRGLSLEEAQQHALRKIENVLRLLGRNLQEFNLPECNMPGECDILEDEERIDDVTVDSLLQDLDRLNPDQRDIFERIVAAVEHHDEQRRYFCLQGSGGTGKTFLYNTILAYLSSKNIPSLAVAFTGIAALLLRNGRTAHSAFRIPLHLNAQSRSSITAQSDEGNTLRNVRLIIWDEITMTSYLAIDVVDRLLQDVCNDRRPFGGKCIIFGGDVKQLLPVAKGRVNQIELFFTNCKSWEHFEILRLTVNMRADLGQQQFSDWLLDIGEGRNFEIGVCLPENTVKIPGHCITNDIVDEIFGNLDELIKVNGLNTVMRELARKVIMCPRNDTCDALNSRVLASLPGEVITIKSIDCVETDDEEERSNFTEEYLNSITPSGMPPHELRLKVGAPIMLLRNLSLQDGLVNGTRLLVKSVDQFLLIAEIVTGCFDSKTVFIPRVDLTSADKAIPFVLKRRQFPVKLCFALTINKAQGQTFDKVGVYLETPVFSHGQLYVALSRARNWDAIKVQVKNSRHQGKLLPGQSIVFTKNIVYDNIIRAISN